MRHWDDIMALKRLIGVAPTYQSEIPQPLRPRVLTEKQYVTGYTFENMTPQAERFLQQKFRLSKTDSIDTKLEQELTTCMRVDLFYQTAECRLVPDGKGVRVVLAAGNRKTVQLHAGVRYDTEEYAALQLGLDIPLKTAIPVSTDVTLRLGRRLMARGEITVHPRSFTRPTLSATFRRNDVDIYIDGDLGYNIRYNQFQAEFLPIRFNLRHFDMLMGLRFDHLHYRNKLGSEGARQFKLSNEHFFSYRFRSEYNSEDNWSFPTRGARFEAEYAYLTDNLAKLDGQTGTSDVSAHWRMSFTLGSRFTLQPMLYGRLLFGTVTPPVLGNTIGGDWFGHYVEQQMPFAGLGNIEYVDRHFVACHLQAQQRIGTSSYLLLRLAGAQESDELSQLLDRHTLLGVQAAYYYNTIFGPVGATVGYSNRTKEPYLYLNLGYEF